MRTRLEELRGLLYQVAGTSTNDDVRQALQLFVTAHEKTDEAVQAVMRATEHVSAFSAVL
ncbi:hypothetical protein SAMN04487904_105218 [Actinopolyspora lacussalsi subsp. righensis]|uniref:Uncharacterized protein n=1 Tax=Actinopolyspora righensis TaxID=995060 RepID=A0A1I6ZV81_9ACTN|nr:hypothetical protein [Actinopolyspora righensis]SFT66576.1 hypothetical protein SAMN04487904_105218 [Actinopolyspora righensis]